MLNVFSETGPKLSIFSFFQVLFPLVSTCLFSFSAFTKFFVHLFPPVYKIYMPSERLRHGKDPIYYIYIYRGFDLILSSKAVFPAPFPSTYDMLLGRLRNSKAPPTVISCPKGNKISHQKCLTSFLKPY